MSSPFAPTAFARQPAGHTGQQVEAISGTLMTMQQLALLWADEALDALVEDMAQAHDLPADWRRRAALVEPRVTVGLQLEVGGQWHKFLHASHSMDPLGPAMAVGQHPMIMMALLPMQHDLDLSAWQDAGDHPLLCEHFLQAPGKQT